MCLFAHSNIPFTFNKGVLRVFVQNLARGSLQLPDHHLGRDDLVEEVPQRHVDNFDAPVDVVPADAVDDELVNFLLTVFDEATIIFAVILHLFVSLEAWTSLILFFVPVDCGHDSHDGLKEKEDIIERMDLELLIECSFDVSLDLIGMSKGAVHVNLLQVFDNTDFLSVVDLFVVLKKLGNDLFIYTWISCFTVASNSFLVLC